MTSDGDGTRPVVHEHGPRYSLRRASRVADGFCGDRRRCLDHVGRVWTVMRPLSARSPRPAAAPD